MKTADGSSQNDGLLFSIIVVCHHHQLVFKSAKECYSGVVVASGGALKKNLAAKRNILANLHWFCLKYLRFLRADVKRSCYCTLGYIIGVVLL